LKPDAKETFAAIDAMLKQGSVPEQQAMFALLGGMKASGSETMLGKWLDNLAKGKVAPEIALDVYEAGVAFSGKTLKKSVGKVDSAMKKQTFGAWSLALHGGDAEEGKAIFSGTTTAACMQCHTMLAGLPSVGPDLSKVATRLTPEHLLRAVVDPQSEIAEGYGLISVTLKNGSVQSGLLAKETDNELTLRLPATTITNSVKKADIVNRTKPASAMPTMTSLLTKMEVRNIVAYLQTLK
jgi:putative heme-binding domain-containing protein